VPEVQDTHDSYLPDSLVIRRKARAAMAVPGLWLHEEAVVKRCMKCGKRTLVCPACQACQVCGTLVVDWGKVRPQKGKSSATGSDQCKGGVKPRRRRLKPRRKPTKGRKG
jgi:hypothetical protein